MELQAPKGLFGGFGSESASIQPFGSILQPQVSTSGFGGNNGPSPEKHMPTPFGPPHLFGLSSRPAAQAQEPGLFEGQKIPLTRPLTHQPSTMPQKGSSLFGARNSPFGAGASLFGSGDKTDSGFGLPSQRSPMDHQHTQTKSAFITAINLKDNDKVEELLSTTGSDEIDRALDIVATSGDPALMKVLLRSEHANVDGLGCDTPLFRASLGHHIEVIKILLDRGADPNKGSRGMRPQGCVVVSVPPGDQLSNPLHAVAGFHCQRGINSPSVFKQQDESELIRAQECCHLLLDAGCNPNAKGYCGYTPLHISAGSNMITVAMTLLENGADPFIIDNTGAAPLNLVRPFHASIPMIELLTGCGLKLDRSHSSNGRVPILDIFKHDHQVDLNFLAPHVTNWNVVDTKGETLLHQLMRCRNTPSREFVASLINLGADVRRKNLEGLEPIHIAASTYCGSMPMPNSPGLAPIIQLLVASGANIEARDLKSLTPLHHGIISGTKSEDKGLEKISIFIRQFQPSTQAIANDGNGVLHFALQDGQPNGFFGRTKPWNPDTLNMLAMKGADPLHVNHDGETLLDTLMQSTNAKAGKIPLGIVQAILDFGVSVKSQCKNGDTLLHVQCRTRLDPDIGDWPDQKVTDLLLSSLDLEALQMTNHAGYQPIHLAATNSKYLVAKLLSKGVSATAETGSKQNVLHLAASAREGNIVGMLLAHCQKQETLNFILDKADSDGRTPLHAACQAGSAESVRLLVEAGAQLSMRDNSNETPLELCTSLIDEVEKSSKELVQTRSRALIPFQDARLGCAPNTQPVDAGQMMEIIIFLCHATGQMQPLRGDYDVEINDRSFRLRWLCFTPLIVQGHYGVFRKLIESGMRFAPGHIKAQWDRGFDLLSDLVDGGYTYLFDMVAESSQSKDWINGSGKVMPYLISATMRNQPNMPILRLIVEKYGAKLDIKAKVWNCIWGDDHHGALHLLARGQNWWQHEAVIFLLGKGANPDLQDDVGRTPLRLAVISLINGAPMSKDIIKSLLENGANPNLADTKGLTPLNEKINDPEVVHLLLSYGGQVTKPDRSADFRDAIRRQDLNTVKEFLEDGQDCNVRLSVKSPNIHSPFGQAPGSNDQFPLEIAIRSPWVTDSDTTTALLKLLLAYGANSLQPSSYNQGSLILHDFIRHSRNIEECRPLLSQLGLDINVRDGHGDTPFLVACQYSELSAKNTPLRCLEIHQRGADISVSNNDGNNCLHYLVGKARDGHSVREKQKAVSLFVSECSDLVKQSNKKGLTPLHIAFNSGADWAWQILLDAGADPTTPSPTGATALHAALSLSSDQLKWLNQFQNHGIDFHSKNAAGETPVFSFVEATSSNKLNRWYLNPEVEFRNVMTELMALDCDIHAVNTKKENLLHVVTRSRNVWMGEREKYHEGSLAVFQMMVEWGLDPMAQDNEGRSALDRAASNSHQNIIDWYASTTKRNLLGV
ncbi:hypothetical protein N7476_000935 [Penicillium atrosanguineum]|uniref:Uncharacterized protein n=1 Tax=Penicillium atrosanguineum TaxID=1132637 RepID=A0A9W9QCK7_9EURO|nr:hypothetical protein N7476_000935 [Penicillium atrosanguineum]